MPNTFMSLFLTAFQEIGNPDNAGRGTKGEGVVTWWKTSTDGKLLNERVNCTKREESKLS